MCDSERDLFWRGSFRRLSSRTCRWSSFARAALIAQVTYFKQNRRHAMRCDAMPLRKKKKINKYRDLCCIAAVAGATAAPSARSSGPSQMQQSAGGTTGPRVIVLPTIEDIHLPLRYQRRPIDQKEIEYINVSCEMNPNFDRNLWDGINFARLKIIFHSFTRYKCRYDVRIIFNVFKRKF